MVETGAICLVDEMFVERHYNQLTINVVDILKLIFRRSEHS
jgi:hypothetical protein